MRILWSVAGVSLSIKRRSKDIRIYLGFQKISEEISTLRSKWLGNVLRRTDNCMGEISGWKKQHQERKAAMEGCHKGDGAGEHDSGRRHQAVEGDNFLYCTDVYQN